MGGELQARLAEFVQAVETAAVPENFRPTAAWCVRQLPALYAKLHQTHESRYADEIARLARALLVGLKDSSLAADLLARLELLPQRPQTRRLIRRQQREDALGGGALAFGFRHQILRVVSERVPGIDFDQIVHRQHFQHTQQIDLGSRVFTQDDGGQNQVPGVFGGVLLPRSVGQWSAAKDLFQLIGFDEKLNLLSETIGHCESIMSLPRKAPA